MIYSFLKNIIGNCLGIINMVYLYINLFFKYHFQYKKLYLELDKLDFDDNNYNSGKIVDYNIHYGCNFSEKVKMKEIITFLKNENAEIYVLQEFPNIKFDNGKYLLYYFLKKLGIKYYHKEVIIKVCNIEYCSIILSKNNIENVKVLNFKRWFCRLPNVCVSVKTLFNEEKTWISNVHLNSDITGYCQLSQCKELKTHIHKLKEPHIILGDFNTPCSYESIKYLQQNFKLIKNKKRTYPSVFPIVKLDYCFTYNFNNKLSCMVRNIQLSDHLPLIIECL
jgi:endonuclease/exonuclease/phosphatase family metal-dependent hydrolase|tara:strand:+ start:500 stop:1336 length:837 start_codon:yes stop_codon:yes gene_type:complete